MRKNGRARRDPGTIEPGEYIKAMARLLRATGRRVGEADPEDLKDLIDLQKRLDQTILEAVAGLRASGCTWEIIGQALGTTRQAAIMRWSAKVYELNEAREAEQSEPAES